MLNTWSTNWLLISMVLKSKKKTSRRPCHILQWYHNIGLIWHVLKERMQCAYSFLKSTTDVFSVQEVWHSPSTFPTMVVDHAFRTENWSALWFWALETFAKTTKSGLINWYFPDRNPQFSPARLYVSDMWYQGHST